MGRWGERYGRVWPAMKKDQFAGIVRHILGAIGAIVVSQGLVDENTTLQASGALATLAAIAWSVEEKKNR